MTCNYRRVDLPAPEIIDPAWSHSAGRLYFLDDAALCSVALEDVFRVQSAAPYLIHQKMEVLADECSIFSVSSGAPIGACVDFEDRVNLVDMADFSVVRTIAPTSIDTTNPVSAGDRLPGAAMYSSQGDAVAALSLSPQGDKLVLLEEIDGDDQPLLLYRWKYSPATDADAAPQLVFGTGDIRMPDLAGWWSNDIACFSQPGSLVFWHATSNRTKALNLPTGYILIAAVFDEAGTFAAVSLEGEGQLVTCRIEINENRFQLNKLLDGYVCMAWEPVSQRLLVRSPTGSLRSVQPNTLIANALCDADTDLDFAVYLAPEKVMLFGDNSVGIVSR